MEYEYRVYKEREAICRVDNIEDLFTILDILILEEENDRVVVIRHNFDYDYDEVMYMFIGNYVEYIQYRDNYYRMENKNENIINKIY